MFDLRHGDCLDVLRGMADNSVDAIVTDPPYGLSFMGKRWDYDVPSEDIWRECLRVLKPGGHLLAFAGTRTQHRMAVRIEDAGFEIRDMIAWVYASGFPKSLDVSKAIDKGHGENRERQLQFTAWMRSTGITVEQINEATGSCMASHYLTDKSQPAIATADMFDKLRPYLPEVPEYIERLVCERTGLEWTAYKQREVVGQKTVNGEEGTAGGYQNGIASVRGSDISVQRQINITAPATDAARQWQGWGTALKPALEPITVARKPLIGTVAENVLTWGTGGVNVDGCRVDGGKRSPGYKHPGSKAEKSGTWNKNNCGFDDIRKNYDETQGRWPANLIHDGSEEVVGLFPETKSGSHKPYVQATREGNVYGRRPETRAYENTGDSGSAARFFYCAKASKRDRDEGCEGMPQVMAMRYGEKAQGPLPQQTPSKPVAQRNHHPTVKPTDLMRYLCRLVTPPGGTVLDPFMGSGSTGKAAVLEGFNFIGIEREAEYLDIARARIEHVTKEPNLWQS